MVRFYKYHIYMPVYPDVEETDETNPYLLDLLDVSNIDIDNANIQTISTFKLKPINVSFPVFERLFFKKRHGAYSTTKLAFLDSLLNKLKPKLSRELRKYTTSACETIALNNEIFGLTLIKQMPCSSSCSSSSFSSLRVKSLSHTEFVRIIDTTNDTYVRTTIHLAVNSISTNLTIEFMFKVKDIPTNPCAFDADDLFL
jgi:hypothetical protein